MKLKDFPVKTEAVFISYFVEKEGRYSQHEV